VIDSKLSRAPGRRKEAIVTGGCAKFESNLQMESRVKVNKQDCFVKFLEKDGSL